MAENRLIKMGKKCDFECHNMEHQLGAYTNCNHGCGLAVIHPVYYRHVYKEGLSKFVRFAENVWGIERNLSIYYPQGAGRTKGATKRNR